MKSRLFTITILLFIVSVTMAQDDGTIDASKPTNFYSFIDNTLENTSSPGQNVMGYRGKVTLAPSEAHLILGESWINGVFVAELR